MNHFCHVVLTPWNLSYEGFFLFVKLMPRVSQTSRTTWSDKICFLFSSFSMPFYLLFTGGFLTSIERKWSWWLVNCWRHLNLGPFAFDETSKLFYMSSLDHLARCCSSVFPSGPATICYRIVSGVLRPHQLGMLGRLEDFKILSWLVTSRRVIFPRLL